MVKEEEIVIDSSNVAVVLDGVVVDESAGRGDFPIRRALCIGVDPSNEVGDLWTHSVLHLQGLERNSVVNQPLEQRRPQVVPS